MSQSELLTLGRINSILIWTGERNFDPPPVKKKIICTTVPDEEWERSMEILKKLKDIKP